jgi:poly-gamma-glutamate system protein
MEAELHQQKIFRHTSVAASLGGGSDAGNGLSPEGRMMLREAVRRNGQLLLESPSLDEGIQRRMAIYDSLSAGRRLKVFINVGGGLASLGGAQNLRLIPPGLTKDLGNRTFPAKGVMIHMAERGVPVIHLLDVDWIAETFHLPVEPMPLPAVGTGSIFSEAAYRIPLAVSLLVAYSVVMFCLLRLDMKHYLFRPKTKEMR